MLLSLQQTSTKSHHFEPVSTSSNAMEKVVVDCQSTSKDGADRKRRAVHSPPTVKSITSPVIALHFPLDCQTFTVPEPTQKSKQMKRQDKRSNVYTHGRRKTRCKKCYKHGYPKYTSAKCNVVIHICKHGKRKAQCNKCGAEQSKTHTKQNKT